MKGYMRGVGADVWGGGRCTWQRQAKRCTSKRCMAGSGGGDMRQGRVEGGKRGAYHVYSRWWGGGRVHGTGKHKDAYIHI
jgi:hypothetical protein